MLYDSKLSAWNEKYKHLLEDKDVKRWFDNVARGSVITAEVYLRRLGAFCVRKKLTPEELPKKSQKEIENLLLDLISDMEKAGYAGSYTHSNIKALKSWLAFNDIEIKEGKLRIKGTTDTPSLSEERVPTQDELGLIFRSGDKKQRTENSFVSHSGLRPETLGDYKGLDGLKLKDLPEMEITKEGKARFLKIPTMVMIRAPISKAGHKYFTFLSEEGCNYLKEYIEERQRNGEKFTEDSPIITPKKADKPFIRTTNIGDSIRESIRTAGFAWRPYVLRAYFDTQMMLAESKGLILKDYRAFFMGHKGTIENRYTTNKQKLPDSVIEDMRQAYRRASQYLVTVPSKDEGRNFLKEFKEGLLLSKGKTPEEIEKIDVLNLSNEEFFKLLNQDRQKERISSSNLVIESEKGALLAQVPRGRHTSVPLGQLQSFLTSGCFYVDKYIDPSNSEAMAIIQYPL